MALSTLVSSSVERFDLRDQVHTILRAEIIQGRLPAGQRLHVGRLADRLGVSPTPIKEALSRLSTEGLVEVGSRGGTFVTRPTKASVDQILELREVLEQFAAERALAVATEADLAALTALCESIKSRINPDGSLAYEGFSLDDVAFHNMLIGLAGNQRLAQMYRDLHAYTIVARAYYQLRAKGRDTDVSGHMRVYHQHMAIVAALRAGDPIALRAAITDHIAGVREFGHRAAELFAQDRSSDAA
jgi:DNA-binding GntR family transcriptional regulator